VYAAALHARASGEDLVRVCARELPEDLRAAIGPLSLDAGDYVGEAARSPQPRWPAGPLRRQP
jgi:hypothetical protein